MNDTEASVRRAIRATPEEHAAARDACRCVICGAAPGVQCTFGGGRADPAAMAGYQHMRRVRAYLDAI